MTPGFGGRAVGNTASHFLRREDCRMKGGKEVVILREIKNLERPREGRNWCKVTQQVIHRKELYPGCLPDMHPKHFHLFHGLKKEIIWV